MLLLLLLVVAAEAAEQDCAGRDASGAAEKRVLDEVMRAYDPKVVPGARGVDVEVDVMVQAISGVSEMSASFTTDLLFSQIWTDPGLRYAQLDACLQNISLSHRMIDSVWVPNVCFVNRSGPTQLSQRFPNFGAEIYETLGFYNVVFSEALFSCFVLMPTLCSDQIPP